MMDKNVFTAVALCALIFLLWQHLYLKPIADRQAQQQQFNQAPQQSQVPQQQGLSPTPALVSQQPKPLKQDVRESFVVLKDGPSSFNVTLSTAGGVVTDIRFDEYKNQKAEVLQTLVGGGKQLELAVPAQEWAYVSNINYSVAESSQHAVVFKHEDSNVVIERKYQLRPEDFSLDHSLKIQFKKAKPNYVFVGLQSNKNIPKVASENERREIWFSKVGGHDTWTVEDIDAIKEDIGEGYWTGFSSRYFLKALTNVSSSVRPQFQARPINQNEVAANLIYKLTDDSNQKLFEASQLLYFGPKDIDILKRVGHRLDMAVNFGWFTFIAYPLLTMLKWFYKFIHNYGIAIILLTLLVKAVLYPLTYKSMKAMKEMQKIQPQMQKLRERYKDDKEKLNREMLQLMKTHGYNPMSGCLPILIQMPIFIALYNVLYGAIDLYGAPFFGWIHDLSAKDPYFITPVLLSLLMYVQQKMTPTTTMDPTQQKMMNMMPIIFGVMMLWLPAGLTLYMLINALASILQQLAINRKLGGTTPATVTAA